MNALQAVDRTEFAQVDGGAIPILLAAVVVVGAAASTSPGCVVPKQVNILEGIRAPKM